MTTAAGGRMPDVSQRSLGELMGQVTQDLSTLVRQEIALATSELREETGRVGRAAGMLSGAGVAGLMLLAFLSVALWWGLANVMDGGWAALVVAAIWGVIAAGLMAAGRARLRQVRGLPRTTETVKQIPEAMKPELGGYR